MKFSLESIFNVDRRIVFIFVFLALLLPLLSRYAMPCKAGRDVLDMFNAIEDAAASGRPVFLAFEFDPTGAAEQEPMARSVLRHLFARGGKAVVMCKSGGQQGEALHLQILEDCSLEYNRHYGEDYIYLPYKPGSTTLVINLGQSLANAWPKDYRGSDLINIPLVQNCGRLADFSYVMVICSSLTTVVDWVTYGQSPYNLKMGFGVLGNVTPDVSNYVQSGQVIGLLGGLVGAAQYEQLLLDNGISALRRFSSADMVRAQVPNFCNRLLKESDEPIIKAVREKLPLATLETMEQTAKKRFDYLTQADKRAIMMAFNSVIESSDIIPAKELRDVKVKLQDGAKLSSEDDLRARRRMHVEKIFASELAKASDPGRAMLWMTPQSIAHVALIIAIILGNISYFTSRSSRRN